MTTCSCPTCQRVRQLEHKKLHIEELLGGKYGFVILNLKNERGTSEAVRIEGDDEEALEEALKILDEDIEIALQYLSSRGHRARRRRRSTVSSLLMR